VLSPELLLMIKGSSLNPVAFPRRGLSKAFSAVCPTASCLPVFFGRMSRCSCRICHCDGRSTYLGLFVLQYPVPRVEASRQ
jgi:hypothetical protein